MLESFCRPHLGGERKMMQHKIEYPPAIRADAAREYADGAAHDANAVFSDDADGEAARLDAQAAARSAAQAADEAEGYRQAVCAPLGYAA